MDKVLRVYRLDYDKDCDEYYKSQGSSFLIVHSKEEIALLNTLCEMEILDYEDLDALAFDTKKYTKVNKDEREELPF